jgi:nucleotide-binding universal stress UspA family protein
MALDYAEDIVGELGETLFLLHVGSPAEEHFISMHRGYIKAISAAAEEQIKKFLEKKGIQPEERPIEVKGEIVVGNAPEKIVEFADENHIDLIIMATHGRSGISHWAIGSVAEKVVRATSKQALLVRTKNAPLMMNKIVVPLDGSKESETIVNCVEKLAAGLKSEVVLLQVLEEAYNVATSGGRSAHVDYTPERIDELKKSAKVYLEGLASPLREQGISVSTEVVAGDAPQEVVKFADENYARLVAMIKRGRSSTTHLNLGRVADKVMHSGSTPVLFCMPPDNKE